ncbi:MAG TPA: hypothetical protein VFR09_05465, partial [Alphaproteobacteria bacterium]|nr:hypothetical protein [Alphaproteobacteria bacterium]
MSAVAQRIIPDDRLNIELDIDHGFAVVGGFLGGANRRITSLGKAHLTQDVKVEIKEQLEKARYEITHLRHLVRHRSHHNHRLARLNHTVSMAFEAVLFQVDFIDGNVVTEPDRVQPMFKKELSLHIGKALNEMHYIHELIKDGRVLDNAHPATLNQYIDHIEQIRKLALRGIVGIYKNYRNAQSPNRVRDEMLHSSDPALAAHG